MNQLNHQQKQAIVLVYSSNVIFLQFRFLQDVVFYKAGLSHEYLSSIITLILDYTHKGERRRKGKEQGRA